MRSLRMSLLVVGAVLAGGDFTRAQNPPPPALPPEFVDPSGKTPRNALSGDLRIRVRRFHAILFFDANQHQQSAKNDREQIVKVLDSFKANFYKDFKDQTQLDGGFEGAFDVAPVKVNLVDTHEATWSRLDASLKKLSEEDNAMGVRPGDVVFFWAEVEGDPRAPNMLQFRKDGSSSEVVQVPRESLLTRLEFRTVPEDPSTRRTHLTVFITDDCSNVDNPGEPKQKPERPGEPPRIWRSLYYGHQGTVDIASSSLSLNQQAISTNGMSVFMRAFRDVFDAKITTKAILDQTPHDEFIDWEKEFIPKLTKRTQDIAREAIAKYVQGLDAKGEPVFNAAGSGLPTALRDHYRRWAKQGGQTPAIGKSPITPNAVP